MKYIGDVVLTTPVIRAVRERFPDAYIAYMGDKRAVGLLEHNPHLNEIIPYDYTAPSVLEQVRVALALRKRKFDVVVDLFSNPRSAVLMYASGARMRIGKDVKTRGGLYTHRISDDGKPKSAIAFHYQYVNPIGVEPTHWRTEVFLTDDERREARIYLKHSGVDLSRPVVAFHPGATWPNKMWPREYFADLIDMLRAKSVVEAILSPGPQDGGLLQFITSRCAAPVVALPVLPLRQLAAVLSHCAAFVSNDCGPMHVGVAVGTPTIGIFGPEPVDVWFPYPAEEGHTPVFKQLFCSPCRTTSCYRKGDERLECLTLLSVREVFAAVDRALNLQRRQSR